MEGYRTVDSEAIEDLELYTCEQLINELMRRHTFMGVVVNNTEELKDRNWTKAKFTAHFNSNLTPSQAAMVLRKVSEDM